MSMFGLLRALGDGAYGARVLAGSGFVAPSRPDRVARAGLGIAHWGITLPGACALGAALHPDDTAIADERGTIGFAELHASTNALANAFASAGVGPDDPLAIMCRNHRGFVQSMLAASKVGADALFLNTGLAGPQVDEILARERPRLLVRDEEFAGAGAGLGRERVVTAWHKGRSPGRTLDRLAAEGDGSDPPAPERQGKVILLTSGTTGAPRGAVRPEPASLDPVVALLGAIPLRARDTTMIASPMFHSWGYTHLGLGLTLSSTLVLRRRFDAAATLAAIEEHAVDVLVAVPTMLQRMLALPARTRRGHDTSSLRVVAVSGSALPGPLATRFMDEFGDVLYNLYGSTEVAWATVAGPGDMRAAPGTAGRPPHGTRVAILDEHGLPVPEGESGRIFAGNGMAFHGYTDGDGKQLIDGMVSTGDLGHLDGAGRLFVDGREDEMIVSGGENVFPSEVEDVLVGRKDVLDASVYGVPDDDFGQRLEASVVLAKPGGASEDELKRHVAATLAPFKVPRAIRVVDELPRNETGKIVKPRAR